MAYCFSPRDAPARSENLVRRLFFGKIPGKDSNHAVGIYTGFEADLNVDLILALILFVISFLVIAAVKGIMGQRLTIF